jgi:hypothetical protein
MRRILVLPVIVMTGLGSSALAEPPDFRMTTDTPITRDSPSAIEFFVADQFTYDDNLYRLPSNFDVTAVAGPLATRADSFNSVTLGGDGRWFSDIQALSFNFRADDNRFIHNDSLDNVSGKGNLEWDWRLGTYWSGQAGVSYFRGLANFANTGYYARDVVQREDYFGNFRFQAGPHWSLYGGFIGADTSQTAVPEQAFNFNSKAGTAGIEFATSSSNTVDLEYRYTNANFPQEFVLNGTPFNPDYNEETARILVKYVFSAATEPGVEICHLLRRHMARSAAVAADRSVAMGLDGLAPAYCVCGRRVGLLRVEWRQSDADLDRHPSAQAILDGISGESQLYRLKPQHHYLRVAPR